MPQCRWVTRVVLALAVLVGFAKCAHANVDNPDLPYDSDVYTIALYHMDQDQGSVAIDSSPNHLDAQLYGTGWTPNGKYAQALVASDGSYVVLPESNALDSPDATYEAWVYLTDFLPDPAEIIVDKWGNFAATCGRQLAINAGRCPYAGAAANSVNYSVTSPDPIPMNEWVHLAAVFNETQHEIQIVVNGIIMAQGYLGAGSDCHVPVELFQHRLVGNGHVEGLIDEVRLSSTARTSPPVPSGACCLADGACTLTPTQIDCSDLGGTYQGDNTSCSPNGCYQPPYPPGNADNFNLPYDPDDDTIVLYHMNQDMGLSAMDATRHHLNAQLYGTDWTSAGRFAQGLVTGDGNYATIPDSDYLDSPDATYEAWIYLTDFQPDPAEIIVDKWADYSATCGRQLGINAGRCPYAGAAVNSINYSVTSPDPIPMNQWVHIAAVFNETQQQIQIAVNGTVMAHGYLAPGSDCHVPVQLFQHRLVGNGHVEGIIDEIRLSSVARIPATASAGACCFADQTCTVAGSSQACAELGGAYQGNNTICEPSPCTDPWWDEPLVLNQQVMTSEIITDIGLETETANDFFASAPARIDEAVWWGEYYNGGNAPNVTGFNLRFYEDADGSPGALIASYPCAAPITTIAFGQGAQGPVYEYHLPVSVEVGTGTYWFSVQACDHGYPPGWARVGADHPTGYPTMLVSEYFGYPYWTPSAQVWYPPLEASQRFYATPILTAAAISGTVASACGGGVPDVSVTVTDSAGNTLNATTDTAGHYSIPGVTFGLTTVSCTIPTSFASADSTSVTRNHHSATTVDFRMTPRASIGGVAATCDGPLANATVDIVDGADDHQVAYTGQDGTYSFTGLYPGAGNLSIIVPLGYRSLSPTTDIVPIDIACGMQQDFTLACVAASGQAQPQGYWKHQVNVYRSGRGSAQESRTNMEVVFPTAIYEHFLENELNSIDVEGVTYRNADGPVAIDLETMYATLWATGRDPMVARAKQQYLSTLLNIASGKLLVRQIVSADGRSVSRAIQYIADLINDAVPANDILARDLAEALNQGVMIASGIIPATYEDIPYREGDAIQVAGATSMSVWPTPFTQNLTLSLRLARAEQVEVRIYDAQGREVARPMTKAVASGAADIALDTAQLPPGVYFCRLKAGAYQRTQTLVRVR